MSYRYKNRIETLAEALSELRWSEMQEFAKCFSMVDFSDADTDTPSFWAALLDDWATDKLAEYECRQKETA